MIPCGEPSYGQRGVERTSNWQSNAEQQHGHHHDLYRQLVAIMDTQLVRHEQSGFEEWQMPLDIHLAAGDRIPDGGDNDQGPVDVGAAAARNAPTTAALRRRAP
jgi:hypothetical protein